MFKNRALQVRVVKSPTTTTDIEESRPTLSQEEIDILKDFVKTTIKFVGVVFVTGKLVDLACELVLRAVPDRPEK